MRITKRIPRDHQRSFSWLNETWNMQNTHSMHRKQMMVLWWNFDRDYCLGLYIYHLQKKNCFITRRLCLYFGDCFECQWRRKQYQNLYISMAVYTMFLYRWKNYVIWDEITFVLLLLRKLVTFLFLRNFCINVIIFNDEIIPPNSFTLRILL